MVIHGSTPRPQEHEDKPHGQGNLRQILHHLFVEKMTDFVKVIYERTITLNPHH